MLVPLAVGDVTGPITKFGRMVTSEMPSAFANSHAAFSASVCMTVGLQVLGPLPQSASDVLQGRKRQG